MGNPNQVRTVIWVQGPDINYSPEMFVLACKQYQNLTCVTVGDGKRDIELEEVKQAFAGNQGPFLLVLNCHGGRGYINEEQEIQRSIEEFGQKVMDLDEKMKQNEEAVARGEISEEDAKLDALGGVLELLYQNMKERFDPEDESKLKKELSVALHSKKDINLRDIFQVINDIAPNVRTDYFVTSCYGGYGHNVAYDYLKPGEKFIALGEGNRIVLNHDSQHFITTFSEAAPFYNGKISAENIYIDFLVTDYNSHPTAISLEGDLFQSLPRITKDKQTFDPNQLSFPRELTPDQVNLVHQRLGSLKDKQTIDSVITKMKSVKSLGDFNLANQGTAIAIQYITR